MRKRRKWTKKFFSGDAQIAFVHPYINHSIAITGKVKSKGHGLLTDWLSKENQVTVFEA